jgi:small subunit ribosomal protein S17
MATTAATKTVKIKKKPARKETPADQVVGTRTGVVESDRRAKTRTVVVAYQAKHPKYGKYIRQRTVIQAHDEGNVSRAGDIVEVAPCRPISASKSWRLVRVVERRSELTAALQSAKVLADAEKKD